MTPFMARVADLIEGSAPNDRPRVRRCGPRPVVDGADEQVMTRSTWRSTAQSRSRT